MLRWIERDGKMILQHNHTGQGWDIWEDVPTHKEPKKVSVEEEKAMNNVLVYIPHVNIPIRHWVEGNVVKFDVPYGLTIYAEAFGIGIKYTEATDDQPNR